jgi:transposase-like protein
MARSRTYRHDLPGPHCGSNWTPKDGHSRGKQTYRCGDCHHRFAPEGNRHYCPQSVKDQALEGSELE